MNYAVIDIGSNSVRMTAYRCQEQTKQISCYLNERDMIGLASYITDGKLNDTGIRKLVAVLKKYKTLIGELRIKNYYVLATASIRNVENTDEIVAKVAAMTGITMQVLSGDQEAQLDFCGVISEISDRSGIIVDIGGGSTEIIQFEDGEISQAISLPLGSLQVTGACVNGIIPTKKERKRMKQYISDVLDDFVWGNKKYPVLYGIGGTCRCALRLAEELFADLQNAEEAQTVSVGIVSSMLKSIKKDLDEQNSIQYLKQVYRVVPERMFSVIPGLMILQQIADRVGAEELKVCLGGIREGFLYQNVLSGNIKE